MMRARQDVGKRRSAVAPTDPARTSRLIHTVSCCDLADGVFRPDEAASCALAVKSICSAHSRARLYNYAQRVALYFLSFLILLKRRIDG